MYHYSSFLKCPWLISSIFSPLELLLNYILSILFSPNIQKNLCGGFHWIASIPLLYLWKMNIFYNIKSLNLTQECDKFFLLSKVSFFIFDIVFFFFFLNTYKCTGHPIPNILSDIRGLLFFWTWVKFIVFFKCSMFLFF